MARRAKNRGLILLRRSGDRQETSLEKQLTWAAAEARRMGVIVEAAPEHLAHMRANRLHSYKSIRLDDAIPGDVLDRPGLQALMCDARADRSVSHVFAFARDRFGRPESPVDMMQKEVELLRAGLTIVCPDKVVELPASGQLDIGELIKMLVDYHASGEHPRKLAEQMINTQRLLAERGRSIGGSPPYGFVRALINDQNQILEYLPRGKRVRQLGCHVVWVPDPEDDEKLRTWTRMLMLKELGWGYKRIANHLNTAGIPSPAAGSSRMVIGECQVNDGLWCASTVKSLLENRVILSIFDYGVRSEGKHRRLGSSGPRFLDETDRNPEGRQKVIKNDPSLWISRSLPFDPKFDPDRWNKIMEETRRRGNSQRGVPRSQELGKYPLSCLVVDLSDGCGALMYGRTSGKRRVYNCGRYMKSGGAACENNQVDAEALLRFVIGTLAELVDRMGAREELEARLLQRAREDAANPAESKADMVELENRIRELRRKKDLASQNAALAEDGELRAEAERLFVRLRDELRQAEVELGQQGSAANQKCDPYDEVAKALATLDDIQRLVRDPAARAEIPALLKRLGVRLGLRFEDAIKGRQRRVRRLASGTIVFGTTGFEEEAERQSNEHRHDERIANAEETGVFLDTPVSASGPSPR